VVTQAPRRSSATDIRRQLHWLPIRQRVSFKLGTITFRAHRLSLRVSCIGINHWGHCALALLPLCTGLTPPLTSTNTHLQSRHRLPGTIYLLPSVILPPYGYLQTAFKTHIFNSAYTSRHWLPSMGTSDSLFRDIWRQLKKFMLIDWFDRANEHSRPTVS